MSTSGGTARRLATSAINADHRAVTRLWWYAAASWAGAEEVADALAQLRHSVGRPTGLELIAHLAEVPVSWTAHSKSARSRCAEQVRGRRRLPRLAERAVHDAAVERVAVLEQLRLDLLLVDEERPLAVGIARAAPPGSRLRRACTHSDPLTARCAP
jgi:hypothetical protein